MEEPRGEPPSRWEEGRSGGSYFGFLKALEALVEENGSPNYGNASQFAWCIVVIWPTDHALLFGLPATVLGGMTAWVGYGVDT